MAASLFRRLQCRAFDPSLSLVSRRYASSKMMSPTRSFGQFENKDVTSYTLSNSNGMSTEILDLGGIVRCLNVPKNGHSGDTVDVVTGCDTVEDYLNSPYFGAITGRYANRIAEGIFSLNGKRYQLEPADGQTWHLHGGRKGFDKRMWDVKVVTPNQITLSYLSPDGEEGYPGSLRILVTYTLLESNALEISYAATAEDGDTILNLTNHSYFNLTGKFTQDTALAHSIRMSADAVTSVDSISIPTGEMLDVKGTPFDFTEFRQIGEQINSDFDQIQWMTGYDHNFCIRNADGLNLRECIQVQSPDGPLKMTVYSDQPGILLYTGNYLDGSCSGKGFAYERQSAFCLETQHYPNSPNNPTFPTTVLKEGETFRTQTIFAFSG